MRLVALVSTPAIARLQQLVARVSALPWPKPAQRITRRGLTALTARFPEVAALLGIGAPRASKPRAAEEISEGVDVAATMTVLNGGTWSERAAAAHALAGSREPEVVAALLGALRDRSIEVASAAAAALGTSGNDYARSALTGVLHNEDGYYAPTTRAAAVQALGSLLPEGQLAPLRSALRDIDAEVSLAAIAALAQRKDEGAAFELTEIVEDSRHFFLPITRLAAARALELMRTLDAATISRLLDRETDQSVQQVLQRIAVTQR